MAGQRLTDKTSLTEQLSSGDLLMTVDVSDTTGSASGTSKQIANKYIIQTDTLSLTASDLDLSSTPQTLVSAPGAGYFIQPLTITCIVTWVSSGTSQSNYLYVSYNPAQTATYLVSQRDFMKSESADTSFVFGGGKSTAGNGTNSLSIENKALYVYSNVDYTGDFTMKWFTTYQIVKI
mgnify:CR=1 FL=1|tara:strand:+ start:192 stop:725 length:534 start_codon:yes stop_codon:yes gene_type:complete